MSMGSGCNWTPKNVSSMFRLLTKALGLKKRKKQPNPLRVPVLFDENNSDGARIVYH